MTTHKEVTPEEFGQMIARWIGQGVNPLEVVGFEKHFDDYLPTIKKYDPTATEETLFVLGGSYPSRSAALAVIGELWDQV